MMNSVYSVVQKGHCSGCGVCDIACQANCIRMTFNRDGEFYPFVEGCNNCGQCLTVCPFFVDNEKCKFSSSNDLCYVGYSNIPAERESGSSGGITTHLLKYLLDKKKIDGVIVVGESDKNDRLFEPQIVKDAGKLIKFAGSKYYPIEFSSVLRKLKTLNGFYAVVGLPCVVSAIRLLQKKQPTIGKKIKYLFGLTCGHNKNKNYTSYLLQLIGADDTKVSSVEFRKKSPDKKASNFGFRGLLSNGEITNTIFFLDSMIKDLWCKRYFSLSACFICSDLFADSADISFMDAWLEPYISDSRGTSMLVVRNDEINDILIEERRALKLTLDPISKDKIIESQAGALAFKKMSFGSKRFYLKNSEFSKRFFSHEKKMGWIKKNRLKLHTKIHI